MNKMVRTIVVFVGISLLTGCSGGPVLWWQKVHSKTMDLFTMDHRFHALEEQNAELEKKYLSLEAKYVNLLADVESQKKGESNLKLTGSKEGRSIASIDYKVPKDMDPETRTDLAYQHLKEKRFSEAAITFDSVLWIPEGALEQTAKNFYEAGVAWYEVKNFKKAKLCFEAATAHADGEEKKEIQRRVDLWMRVLAKNSNKDV